MNNSKEPNKKAKKILTTIQAWCFWGFFISIGLNYFEIVNIHFAIYSFIPPLFILIIALSFIVEGFVEGTATQITNLLVDVLLASIVLMVFLIYTPFSIAMDYLSNGLQEETVYIERYIEGEVDGGRRDVDFVSDTVTFNNEEYRVASFYSERGSLVAGQYVTVKYLKNAKIVID